MSPRAEHAGQRQHDRDRTVRELVDDLAAELRWVGAFRFARGPWVLGAWPRRLSAAERRRSAQLALRDLIYQQDYAQAEAPTHSFDRAFDHGLLEALEAATVGEGRHERGWGVVGVDGDHLWISDGKVVLWVDPSRHLHPDDPREVGQRVRLKAPPGRRNLSPGFYYVTGDAGVDREGGLVRLYVHQEAKAAPPLLRALTSALNGEGHPFEFKTLAQRDRYARRDTGVLYVGRRTYPRARALLLQLAAENPGWFQPGVPLFTKRLAPGIGAAEDPEADLAGNRLSFGQHRCGLIAQGLFEAHLVRRPPWECVQEAFQAAGVDPDRPWLRNADSPEL